MTRGEIIRAGTMTVDGEVLTGVFVECDADDLKSDAQIRPYKAVEIRAADEKLICRVCGHSEYQQNKEATQK